MPQSRLANFLKMPQVQQRMKMLGPASAKTGKQEMTTVHVDSLYTENASGAYLSREGAVSYCIRAVGGPGTQFVDEQVSGAADAPFRKSVFREVMNKVPKYDGFVELEVHRQLVRVTEGGEREEKFALVGTINVPETQGFEPFEVLAQDGSRTGWTLRVEVPPVYEALSETVTMQVDRLFGIEKVDGAMYFVRAGVRGQESRTTRLEPGIPNLESEALHDCTWQRQQLLGVPKSKEGISILVCRASQGGVSTIGRVLVSESTTSFTSFPVLKDGKETGMTLRLHSPPIERPPVVQKRAWLPRLRKRQGTTATTSSGSDTEPPSFNAAQLAAAKVMERVEATKRLDKLYDDTEAEAPAPRKRPSMRSTRRTQRRTDASTVAEWDEDEEAWPEDVPEDQEDEGKDAELERKRRIVMPEMSPRAVHSGPGNWVRAGSRWTRKKPEAEKSVSFDEDWPSDEA